ncbi:MAG: 50S ribosomal protein L23 [Patescibacteria group bacterium]|jgi:ribosomal protein L23
MSILNKIFQADEIVEPSVKKPSAVKKKQPAEKQAVVATEKQAKSAAKATQEHGDVLLRAVVTEKAGLLQAANCYVFAVRMDANKYEIADAVKKTYGVRPVAVRVLHMPSKSRIRKSFLGSVPAWKKAIVTIPAGKRITVAEGV